jgi:uncharacterized protein with FMN-binding domain
MRRTPAVVAGVAGFAGIVAMHTSSAPLHASAPPPAASAAPSTTTPRTSPGATTTPSPTPSTGGPRTTVGQSEQYGYGMLAVKVTEVAGRITDVSLTTLQTAEQYSQNLAQQVIPVLRNEVLSAQSANINGISGATYTSQAYASSVQSALDALGVK